MNKKGKKGKKFEFVFKRHYVVYAVLSLIIVILLSFFISNYNKCKIYTLKLNTNGYVSTNGLMVLTNKNNILELGKIEYKGDVSNIVSIALDLCVEIDNKYVSISSFGSNSGEGIDLPSYLERVAFNINEKNDSHSILTKKIKKNIKKGLYLKINIVTLEGEQVDEILKINVSKTYSNNKLFY